MYIDEFIILNFIIDYIILSSLSSILKLNTTNKRILLSSLIGEISIISLFFNMNYLLYFLFQLIVSSLMILFCFKYNDLKTFIKNYIYYYIISFFLGGCLYFMKDKGLLKYKYFLIFIPLIMNIFKRFIYNLKNILTLKYRVTVYLNNGKILYLNGLMDTGNTLIEPYSNRKVIIISNKKIKENFYYVPIKTVSNNSLIKCFNPKKVYIEGIGERNDISVGVVNEKFIGFNCLLNYKLMEEI